MRTNLFRCGEPGQTNLVALRYLFTNASVNPSIHAIALSLIQAITGFDPTGMPLRIHRVWDDPLGDIGLNVEIAWGEDHYHLCFFSFAYEDSASIEKAMIESSAILRGDHDTNGCFLILYRPEDAVPERFLEAEQAYGVTAFVHTTGELVYGAIGRMRCRDPFVTEYLDYICSLRNEMTTEKWNEVWLSNPVGFLNYCENYLCSLIKERYDDNVSFQYYRSGWKSAVIRILIDTGFELTDLRGESVDSWFVLECRIGFPCIAASVRVKGDCFCYEEPQDWIPEENMNEAFYRMRKALDQEGSLFLPKGGKTEPESLVGEYKEGGIPLQGESAWSDLFPETLFRLADNILTLLRKSNG